MRSRSRGWVSNLIEYESPEQPPPITPRRSPPSVGETPSLAMAVRMRLMARSVTCRPLPRAPAGRLRWAPAVRPTAAAPRHLQRASIRLSLRSTFSFCPSAVRLASRPARAALLTVRWLPLLTRSRQRRSSSSSRRWRRESRPRHYQTWAPVGPAGKGIDVSGEPGEYHSTSLDAPLFKQRVEITKFTKKSKVVDFGGSPSAKETSSTWTSKKPI